jgi:hypothetical protein
MNVGPAVQLVALGLPLIGYALAWWLQPKRRARRELERAHGKHLGELRDGDRVRVTGVARRLKETLISPVTGRACIGFRFVIEASTMGADWMVVVHRSSCAAFGIVEDGVEATVEGPFLFGLDFDDRGDVWANLSPGLFGVLEDAKIPLSGSFGSEKEFRFREAVLQAGDRIMVLGPASIEIDRAGTRENFRGPPLRRVIRGGAGEPVVIADADEEDLGASAFG